MTGGDDLVGIGRGTMLWRLERTLDLDEGWDGSPVLRLEQTLGERVDGAVRAVDPDVGTSEAGRTHAARFRASCGSGPAPRGSTTTGQAAERTSARETLPSRTVRIGP